MRTRNAAEYLGIATSTLAKMRIRGDGPRYAKAGRRIVVYDKNDLALWLQERLRLSTKPSK
jgi:predicted DNA-binding transcriptional regulator AlpA